jgi:glycosyltransferase involved in cell wall biosynthesis
MRFVFVSGMSLAPWGGSEELWSRTAVRLVESGHRVSAWVPLWSRPSSRLAPLSACGVDLHLYKWRRSGYLERAWHVAMQALKREPPAFKWLRRTRPDLVVISQGGINDGLEWMEFCGRHEIPFAAILHCNAEAWWPSDEGAAVLAGAYAKARRLYYVSYRNVKLLERQIGVSLPHAVLIRNPYNVSPDLPPAWPADLDVHRLACVARLDPGAKGQDVLFRVLDLPHWRNRAVEVNLYGSGVWEATLRRMADRLQLQAVRFRGHVDDVKQIWRENSLLVLPSRWEGLPLALVEAMWCGRPAVVTNVGGNAELCLDEQTGFVAEAPTVSLVNEALERAWSRRPEWEDLGRAARRRVEELIPRDPIAEACRQLLDCASA